MRCGSNLTPSVDSNTMPTTATGSPTTVISSTPNGSAPDCSSRSDTTRLVEVPIRVITPPRMLANESGSRYRDASWPVRCDHRTTRGANIAIRGVLGTTADNAAVVAVRVGSAPRRSSDRSTIEENVPVAVAAPASTYRAAMVAGAGLDRPLSARSGSMTPVNSITPTAPASTITGGNRSVSSTPTVPIKTIRAIQESALIEATLSGGP